ncbi:MAG: C40 family peptidase [Gorillibacterium sp.]|nr:C40 family peptidase [Gorillibacterium sp.]
MTDYHNFVAAVSVATIWTSPESPRAVDAPALQNPVDIDSWLTTMTLAEKLNLCDANRIQSQILYGTPVLGIEEQEHWVKVCIPDQPTPKEARGYPGWLSKNQLLVAKASFSAQQRYAVVSSKKAWLYESETAQPCLELSYMTSLPIDVEDSGESEWVRVTTPHGLRLLRSSDIRITTRSGIQSIGGGAEQVASLIEPVQADSAKSSADMADVMVQSPIGDGIVHQARRFLGLPYLWGGMSSYGFDCSGFAYTMHQSQGLLIPRDASAQAEAGRIIESDQLAPGDLLFFAHQEGQGRVHHVGIYAGSGQMIHSPDSASCVELVELAHYKLLKEHCISRRYWN